MIKTIKLTDLTILRKIFVCFNRITNDFTREEVDVHYLGGGYIFANGNLNITCLSGVIP